MTIRAKNSIIVLGSGTSTGIPTVGCKCEVCLSSNPKNKRFRTSIFFTSEAGNKVLVDTTPDLRSQCLANGVDNIDYAILTHEHADHLHGVDDLRPFCFTKPPKVIPFYAADHLEETLRVRYDYIFNSKKKFNKDRPIIGGGIPLVELKKIEFEKPVNISGDQYRFWSLPHGHTTTAMFCYESPSGNTFAYIVDCHEIPKAVITELKKIKIDFLIIDCLQQKSHQTHLSMEQTFDYIDQIGAEKSGLIHMNHAFDHDQLTELAKQRFGPKVFPLYDGQIIHF